LLYSIVQYSIGTVQYWYYSYLNRKVELDKIYFILFEKFSFVKTGLNKNSIKNSPIENSSCGNMIWLAWERVYFRLKIFLFRNSFLWNVKKEEFMLAEQTRIFHTSSRRPYWRPILPSVNLLEACWKTYPC
jgi:hypothetical protein